MRLSEALANVASQPDNVTIKEVDGRVIIIPEGVMAVLKPLIQAALTDGTFKLPAGTGTTASTMYAATGTTLLRANYSAIQNFTLSGDTLTAGPGGGMVEYGTQLIKAGSSAVVTVYVAGASTDRSQGIATPRLYIADSAATIGIPTDDNTSSGAELSVWQTLEGLPKVMANSYPSDGRNVYNLKDAFDVVDNGGRYVVEITPTLYNIHLFRSDNTEQALNNDTLWHQVTRKTTGDLKIGFVTQNANAMAKNPQLTIS